MLLLFYPVKWHAVSVPVKMKKATAILSILFFILTAHTFISETPFFHIPTGWPKPEYDFSKNPLTAEKIRLGKALFYDPLLSRNNTISCNSCHSQFTAFAHVDHTLSHGIDSKIGTRNSPAIMNLAWQKSFMWDGSIDHLEAQPLAPMTESDEMDSSIDTVVNRLQSSGIYPVLFFKAFGDSNVTGEHALKALAQFMVTLVSDNAKYDSVMRKQAVFTKQEENGYRLFRLNCGNCHSEPLFTNQAFENNGLPVDPTLNDYGRMIVTKNPADSLRFKVPTLRNIEFSYPYMHDGRFKSLNEVMQHYTTGIQHSKTLSPPLEKPLLLSSNEKVDLIAFLLTLSDKKFLFNPDYFYPRDIFLENK
jgi:cytochrome c peroxidase